DRHRELATPLQHDQAPRLNRIQATSTRGIRARIRSVAGCATPTGSAGHAGATANLKLTFHPDHSAGANHLLGSHTLTFLKILRWCPNLSASICAFSAPFAPTYQSENRRVSFPL